MVSVESLEHVDQRRLWLYKVWAPSKIIIFHGAQIDAVLTWVRKNAMELKFWWGILRMRTTCSGLASRKTAELKKIVPPESLEHVGQRRWWLYKIWAPSKIFDDYNFRWGSHRHSIDPNQKEGYRGDCFGEASLYPDNTYASVEVVKHRNERRWCL